ncbi:MAG: rod shape-determining protein [Deltaproteobacteria bacterium]|jgi:hypothetical protein|nr:rod shape-determining protein [Deltaproteobacteria bacterium]
MARISRRNIIGIDFGTSNTYLTICPYGTKNKFPLHFSGPSPAVDTAILYAGRPGADQDLFPVIGERATVTFGQADRETKEQKEYRYYANFKPEIVINETARQCTVDFFRVIKREAQMIGIDLGSPDNSIIIGVPSEAKADFCETLKSLLEQAGLGPAEAVEEPKGVLLTDLGYNRFPLADILDGHLVVDFGGGTCDFALMSRGEIVSSWGDMELGGRLFDDLFYQWFLEQNPGAEAKLQAGRREFYVWSYCCRRLKEDFSETVSRNPRSAVSAEVGRFGTVRDLTADEFIQRAGHYKPSQAFAEFSRSFGFSMSQKMDQPELDLIGWFKNLLAGGLKDVKIKNVSLSGGSSKWFFVRDLCLELIQLPADHVLISPNPFGAISEGLAILPAVKLELESLKARMTAEKQGFINDELLRPAAENLKLCTGRLTEKLTAEMFDGRIGPLIKEFSRTSFRIKELEDRIAAQIDGCRELTASLAENEIAGQAAAIKTILTAKIQSWLESFGLRPETMLPAETGPGSMVEIGRPLVSEQLIRPLVLAAEGLVAGSSSLIAASICGGTGAAVLAAGPLGLFLGALGGLGLSGLGLTLGRGRLKEMAKNQSLPKFLARFILSDRNIAKIRGEFQKDLAVKIDRTFQDIFSRLPEELEQIIDRAVSRIDLASLF